MDFTGVKAITIPEGNVKKIINASGVVLWQKVIENDTTAPVIESIGGRTSGTNYWYKAQTIPIVVREENLDYISHYYGGSNKQQYDFENKGTIVKVEDMVNNGDGTYTYTLVDDTGRNGSVVLQVMAVDKSGNTSYSYKGYYRFDNTPPVITGVENGKTYNTSVTPIITDTKIGSIKLNGANFVSGSEITANGSYTLVATDKAGNKTTVTFTVSIL